MKNKSRSRLKKELKIRMPYDLWRRLNIEAKRTGQPINAEMIERLQRSFLIRDTSSAAFDGGREGAKVGMMDAVNAQLSG